MILKFFRVKMARFGFDDVGGKLQHVLWNFFVRDLVEIFILFAYLVRIAQRNPEKTFTTWFEYDHVLAGGKDNPAERYHTFFADRLTNDRERLLTDFAIGGEVIRAV